ncbi:glycosyltransferase family 4 protein [uncultured Bdellovibrio sp.]|uniref:glycosyltransferase family 4 protein n=1 Tax=Bdellovibrio sp. HCB-162 TaxID=3394234 RepID=UPI0025F98A2D|nr:glycosyltransferase family 4 protein [uncultured Bdellovibrio sp.]
MGEVRVLHCIQSLSWGGLELYTVELIQNLAKAGVNQRVFCSAHSRVAEELRHSNVELITFPEKKISKLKAASLIRKISRANKITHLHSHTRIDMWCCALSRWNTSSPKHIYNLYMNALPKRDLIHRWLFSKVDALCSSSEWVLSEARKNFPIAPEKLRLMRYGRKTEDYQTNPSQREDLRAKMGFKKDDLVFGTLCRIDAGKGVRELVEALDYLSDEEIKKIHMVIVGDPTILGKNSEGQLTYESQSLELSEWISQKASEPRLKGHLHRVPFQKNFIPYIDILDVFILASYNETYSLSVLDSMLMEKPVIGTDAGGTTEQVGKNERGFLTEPRNAKSLSEALRFYIQNPDQVPQQGAKARQWTLGQHSWDQTLTKTLALYKELEAR